MLGDKSLAAPLLRTQGLAAGRRLTEVTLDFCRNLGIAARVLPMSDDPVRTHVLTDEGAIPFPEYFGQLALRAARARHGVRRRRPGAGSPDEVLDALHAADLEAVVICPSNPYHVIRPILEISGMRELLRKRGAPVIAVTPIVGGKALKGSAGKMMRELGKEPSPRAVAGEYLRLIDGFVLDREDVAPGRERALARHPGAGGADRDALGRRPRRARARGARLRGQRARGARAGSGMRLLAGIAACAVGVRLPGERPGNPARADPARPAIGRVRRRRARRRSRLARSAARAAAARGHHPAASSRSGGRAPARALPAAEDGGRARARASPARRSAIKPAEKPLPLPGGPRHGVDPIPAHGTPN